MQTIGTEAAAAMHRERMRQAGVRRRSSTPRHRSGVRVRVGLGLVRFGLAMAQPLTVRHSQPQPRCRPAPW